MHCDTKSIWFEHFGFWVSYVLDINNTNLQLILGCLFQR